jgi:hypothetical protein
MRLSARRPGFALAVALFSMVVIGALIAGAFFASTQEYRIGRNTLVQERALAAAEYGEVAVLDAWSTDWNTRLADGDTLLRRFTLADGSSADVTVTKLTTSLFYIVSEGRAGSGIAGDARRRVGSTLRLDYPEMNILAALTAHGDTRIGGSSSISGADSTISGWDCPPVLAPKPGIAIDDTTRVSTSGCRSLTCVDGNPQIQQTAAAADTNTYFKFGDMTWQELTAMADPAHVYPAGATVSTVGPVDSAGVKCRTDVSSNWGDIVHAAGHPCQSFYPIIYARGDLLLAAAGSGQGILLVEGDLTVNGGFDFYGPVIVRGALKTQGTGGHFNGGVMAANVDLEQNTVLGDAVINYSSCALLKALSGSALPIPLRDRAWTNLY